MSLVKFQIAIFFYILKNKTKYDYVHSCDLDVGLPSAIACKLVKKKYIYDIFDYYPDSRNLTGLPYRLSILLERFVINGADTTIICSEQRINQISRTSPKKIVVIHNSPPKYIAEENGNQKKSNRFSIAYFGLLGEGRLVKELVDIIKTLPDIDLQIGGMGPLEGYVKEAAEESENIHFFGKLEYDCVLNLESKCNLMIATYDPKFINHKYAAPNKFYEAIMLGKPVVMIKDTGMDKIISENNFGIVIEKYDMQLLKEAIQEIKDNYQFYVEKNSEMKRVYEEKFSWAEMGSRLEKIYEE